MNLVSGHAAALQSVARPLACVTAHYSFILGLDCGDFFDARSKQLDLTFRREYGVTTLKEKPS